MAQIHTGSVSWRDCSLIWLFCPVSIGVAYGLFLCLSLNNRPYRALNFPSVTMSETSCVCCDSYYAENEDRIACAMKRTERSFGVGIVLFSASLGEANQ